MTTNQTIDGVPRELLERLLIAVTQDFATIGEVRELRALLDADKVNNRQMGLMQFVEAHPIKPPAQPQVEPVAYRCRHSENEPWFFSDKPGYWEWQALYAEQPAPVAVVMPERLQEIHSFLDGSGTLDGYSFGSFHPSDRKFWWRKELRTCLDELKRLNPSL